MRAVHEDKQQAEAEGEIERAGKRGVYSYRYGVTAKESSASHSKTKYFGNDKIWFHEVRVQPAHKPLQSPLQLHKRRMSGRGRPCINASLWLQAKERESTEGSKGIVDMYRGGSHKG